MFTAEELAMLIEMAAAAPIGSYSNAKKFDPLFRKAMAIHAQLAAPAAPAAPDVGVVDTRGGVVIPAGGTAPLSVVRDSEAA